MKKHIHIIGIGGIGVSALARYYLAKNFRVTGSDETNSDLIKQLESEGIKIFIGDNADFIDKNTSKVVYSEAIVTKPDLPKDEQILSHPEIAHARYLWVDFISYPVALAEIFNGKKGIAVTGSHGKSTTTAMAAVVLKNSSVGASVIVGTQVPQLDRKNCHIENSENFVIEACEYKRSFLQYFPFITIITNIDLDHLDYYRDLEDYISAFQQIVDQTSGFVIISENDKNSQKLRIPEEKKIIVGEKISYFAKVQDLEKNAVFFEKKSLPLPEMHLKIPGDHILQDAKLVFTLAKLLGLEDAQIVKKLESYSGSWRRMELVGMTKNGNIIFSDYGHHPNEIRPTLASLRQKYPEKTFLVVFQPHQHSRTRQLLSDFSGAFGDADVVIVPNIYFSRDKKEDVEFMTTKRFVEAVSEKFSNISDGKWLQNTAKKIRDFDKNTKNAIILLLGAGDVDTLRNDILQK